MSRQPRGEGSIHPRPNGTFCGQIDLGPDVNGKRRRRTVYGATRDEVRTKMRQLRRQLEDHGDLPTADIRLEKWLTYWLDSIAAKRLKPNTLRSYRTAVNEHIIPTIGRRPLSRLTPAHIRSMHDALADPDRDRKLSPTTVHNAHRILGVALNDAIREGRVGRNVAAIEPAPAKAEGEGKSLTADEALRVLRYSAEAKDPMFSRWMFALLTGARQGECLGMRWDYLDLDNRHEADLSWSLQRVAYVHGCKKPCGLTARRCPDRRPGLARGLKHERLARNLVLLTPKTAKSRRVVPLAAPLLASLLLYRDTAKPNAYGLVWTEAGEPIDPRDDWAAWRALLKAAKAPIVPLHATRHTTATLLMELGASEHLVSAILGHSSAVTTRSYQHVDQRLARAALDSLGELLALPQ